MQYLVGDKFKEEVVKLFDSLPDEAKHEFVTVISNFSCVPYRPLSADGCMYCHKCWLEYFKWLKEKYSQ